MIKERVKNWYHQSNFLSVLIACPHAVLALSNYVLRWLCFSIRPFITISAKLQGSAFASAQSPLLTCFGWHFPLAGPSDKTLFQEVLITMEVALRSQCMRRPLCSTLWNLSAMSSTAMDKTHPYGVKNFLIEIDLPMTHLWGRNMNNLILPVKYAYIFSSCITSRFGFIINFLSTVRALIFLYGSNEMLVGREQGMQVCVYIPTLCACMIK